MSEKHLYEYAIIRVLPKVEREEFINIGVIVFSKRPKYLKVRYLVNISRLSAFSSEIDIDALECNLLSFQKICEGDKSGGIIASLDTSERFRWLTAVRSTCLQTSRTHAGFSDNLDDTLEKLFVELVL